MNQREEASHFSLIMCVRYCVGVPYWIGGYLIWNNLFRLSNMWMKLSVGVAYIAMVGVNFLANGLPINDRSTGAISDAYPNLFAPAGVTFSIWGLIYFLLAGYVAYQFGKSNQKTEEIFDRINPLFLATSLANISWIFAWHYDYIGLSMVIMAVLLMLLVRIADTLRAEQFTSMEKLLIQTPFSVYFGWITVAAIANVTVFLVSIDWNGFGMNDVFWTNIILLVGASIGILRMRKDRNIAYGLVLIWAYLGILLKHVSAEGFDGYYPSVITIVLVCLVSFVVFLGKIFYQNK